MDKTKQYKVSIFGDQYSLVSDEAEEHVTAAAQRVDQLIREVAGKMSYVDHKRAAVLVALQAWSKLIALEAAQDLDDQKKKHLIEMIDREMYALASNRS